MIHETILVITIVLTISALLCSVIIPLLHKLKFGQQVKRDGSQAHLKKQGAPTMGGLVILHSITTIFIFHIPSYPKIIPVLFMATGFGIIGFLGDYIKIVMKRLEGLKPMQKLAGQSTVTGIFARYPLNNGEAGVNVLIPFTGGFNGGESLSPGILLIPVLFFTMLSTDNGVNFTDGLNGLCVSVTILVVTLLTIVAIGKGMGISSMTGAAVGSLLGFLLFSVYPAKVLVGGAGSLALGGSVAVFAYIMRTSPFIPIIDLVYLVEVLSAIIQVTCFKRTGGRRIFKMAPTHHHSKLYGQSETRIVAVLATVTVMPCVVAYLGLQSHAYGGEVN